jgi:RES domain-containing protein
MILYHLDKWKYRKVWPPEGALFADGRWNKPGQWVIYSSPTVSLAKLEILANENSLPIKRVCMTIKVADNAEVFDIKPKDLPHDWMDIPYPVSLVDFTEQFIDSGKLLMLAPSAQSYQEYNYLINVRHPDFNKKVKLLKLAEEPFDHRLDKVK